MYNTRNPAIKRIMQEMREMAADEDPHYHAEAVEADIFEWHFAILGAEDSEFDGGIYHGRIILPSEYPFKPPSFQLLTPSGRFQVLEKICLSMTAHHPEHWQPSWSVRTALTAVRAFMPTPAEGAVGSLDYTAEERRQLAARSRAEPPRFGNADRQAVIDRVHATMLDRWRVVASARGARETQGETSGTPAANQTKVNAVEDARMATAVAAAAATEAAVASGASNRERANDNAEEEEGIATPAFERGYTQTQTEPVDDNSDAEARTGNSGSGYEAAETTEQAAVQTRTTTGTTKTTEAGAKRTEIEVEANGSRDCGGSSSIEREETKDGDADGGSTAESAEGKTDEPHGAQMTATDSASATETATPTETVTPARIEATTEGRVGGPARAEGDTPRVDNAEVARLKRRLDEAAVVLLSAIVWILVQKFRRRWALAGDEHDEF